LQGNEQKDYRDCSDCKAARSVPFIRRVDTAAYIDHPRRSWPPGEPEKNGRKSLAIKIKDGAIATPTRSRELGRGWADAGACNGRRRGGSS
jgi:hypothetical protein